MVYVKRRSTEDLFWKKVNKNPGQGPWGTCWIWTACKKAGGYGRFYNGHSVNNAQIWAYKHSGKPFVEGVAIDHLCNNPSCVNPDHLEQVGTVRNIRRHFIERTHCQRGHRLTQDNLYFWRNTASCKHCIKLQKRAYALGIRMEEYYDRYGDTLSI